MVTPLLTREITLKATRTSWSICLQWICLLDHCTGIKCQNTLLVTGQDSITVQTEHGIETLWKDMKTTHEEADVIIPQQIHIAKQWEKVQNFKVICDETDMFVLLLYYYVTKKWTGDILLVSLEEEWSLISIKKTAEKHGFIAPCLPAMHAFTGCGTSPRCLVLEKCLHWMSCERIHWVIWETRMYSLKSLLKRQTRLLLGVMLPRVLWTWLK